MNWFRKFPVFSAFVFMLGLLLLGEAALVGERWKAARTARRQLDRVKKELRTLAVIEPAPTRENAGAIGAELARLTKAAEALRAELASADADAGESGGLAAPTRRPEAFFALASFIEEMRTRAMEAGVGLRPEERFGFSSYAHEAPETGQLAEVFRQKRVLEFLLSALIEAQPREVLWVQRPRMAGKAGAAATGNLEGALGRRATGGPGSDFFEIDPRLSLRVPGIVDTLAFRLSFTGRTSTLRALLVKLGEFELPVVVRAVEVVPAERPLETSAVRATAPVSMVASAWSRFTVTVEFITLVVPGSAVS
jgi:hypothetical protein